MPPLDAFQINEFTNHWSECYAIQEGGLVWIRGSGDDPGSALVRNVGTSGVSDRSRAVHMESITPWRLLSGYYNLHVDGVTERTETCAVMVTREPRQHHKRGINSRNTTLQQVIVVDGENQTPSGRNRNLFDRVNMYKVFAANWQFDAADMRRKLSGVFPELKSAALTRHVVVVRDQATNVPMVIANGAVVGYVQDDTILVHEGCSCFMQLLQKQSIYPVRIR